MATSHSEVERYFKHVVQQYICGDINELLNRDLEVAGPLLDAVVKGIDTVGGRVLKGVSMRLARNHWCRRTFLRDSAAGMGLAALVSHGSVAR